MALIGQVVSEKMFEYYGNIHVCCPGVGANEPLGPFFFSESLIFSHTTHILQDFHLKLLIKSFPHSNALATYVDLAIKKDKVITGS